MRTITRDRAISEIRGELMKLVDDDHSMCQVAADHHIFCGGFAQWTFRELKQRYPQIVRSRPRILPEELRDLANRWQLARQTALGEKLACDAQERETTNRMCGGWSEFDDAQLASFHASVCHEEVQIAP